MNIQLEIRIVLYLQNLPIVFVLGVQMLVKKLANVLHNNCFFHIACTWMVDHCSGGSVLVERYELTNQKLEILKL